jgi:hypothetical protein
MNFMDLIKSLMRFGEEHEKSWVMLETEKNMENKGIL